MVIDTSAIVAIALNEPEAASFEQRIADDPVRLISAATLLEAAMAKRGLGKEAVVNSICGFIKPASRSLQLTPTRRIKLAELDVASVRDVIQPA